MVKKNKNNINARGFIVVKYRLPFELPFKDNTRSVFKFKGYNLAIINQSKSVQKRLKWAKFPYHKTLTEFDLSDQTSLSKRQLTQLQELTWLEQQYNLIFLGPSGVGKTHLSIALGMEAIQKGFQVTFVTMGELLSLLKT